MVLAPEHPLVEKVTTDEYRTAVRAYQDEASKATEIERQSTVREKTGVFTGAYCVNPLNQEKVPIWIADYVLASYGTGAIMAVPAHDDRDHEFAKLYDLEIIDVVAPPSELEVENKTCFTGEGTSINSPSTGDNEYTITGLETTAAKAKIIAHFSILMFKVEVILFFSNDRPQ